MIENRERCQKRAECILARGTEIVWPDYKLGIAKFWGKIGRGIKNERNKYEQSLEYKILRKNRESGQKCAEWF